MWFLSVALAAPPTYTLSFEARDAQLLNVRAELDASEGRTTLQMATWTPGSYLIREFARHVEGLDATTLDGAPLPVRKISKNRWQVDTDGVDRVVVRYAVYARQLNVRGNWVEPDLAVINGAGTFLAPVGYVGPYEVDLRRPEGWSGVVTALERVGPDRFRARDYDQLVDAPIVAGSPHVQRFVVAGVEHVLADFPAHADWDPARGLEVARRIVVENHRMWGSLPYPSYTFLNWLGEGRGGLEHHDSTLVLTRRAAQHDPDLWRGWMRVMAHEHFHVWNGKRLRPVALGPFDYEQENYTPSLWAVEGLTSYYDDLILARAGLLDEQGYLDGLNRSLSVVAESPGRLVQSLTLSSHDAWIEHYRPDEHSPNQAVSYYAKGEVVGFLLDAAIREQTRGRASLDDVMRAAFARYGGDVGYTEPQLRALIDEVGGGGLTERLEAWIDRPGELPLGPAMALYGLRLAAPEQPTRAWLGVQLDEGGRVRAIRRDGPAFAVDLLVGDELIAIQGERVADLDVLKRRRPGERVVLTIARRGLLREVPVVLGDEPTVPRLVIDEDASRAQRRARAAWLSGATPR